MGFLGFNFNLKDQLTFYGSYHSNPLNQAIHFVFVPAILWTVAVWLAYTPAFAHFNFLPLLPSGFAQYARYLVLNGSFVLLGGYALYYLFLEPFAGLSWAAFVALPMWVAANYVQQHVLSGWGWALGLHLLSWFAQVHFGHNVAEKRKPALLDSFFQSLVLAPLFVWFELLFLLGYRPQLASEVQAQAKANILAWKQGDAATANERSLGDRKQS
ncbi:hypothetical protein N2152v2_004558 [Parachlorella kessleri]